jgi:membrane fusion protein (multidrug efflux system)
VITAGLNPGERVIVDGVMKLGPGAPVRIAQKKQADSNQVAEKK